MANNNPTPRRNHALSTGPGAVLTRKRKVAEILVDKPQKQTSQTVRIQPALAVAHFANALCGRETFNRLRDIVSSWRSSAKPLLRFNHAKESAAHLVRVVSLLEQKSLLNDLLLRFAKYKLSMIHDTQKLGRIAADPAAINSLLDDLQWNRTKQNRGRLHAYLKEGRRWASLCAGLEGLLWLIPPNRATLETNSEYTGLLYYNMAAADVQELHATLRSNKLALAMCEVGRVIEKATWEGLNIPEFKWETADPAELNRCTPDDLGHFAAVFPQLQDNLWRIEEEDEWPCPDRWEWEWPWNPGWVPPSQRQCSLCDSHSCDCITSKVSHGKDHPRISDEGRKGQGIRAVGKHPTGQLLGEFVGKFVPLGKFRDNWSIIFTRPDLNDDPVAELHARDVGNWVRKVNHACKPATRFEVRKISGQWRQMLVAIRDICPGDEITVSYGGGGVVPKNKCLCEACV